MYLFLHLIQISLQNHSCNALNVFLPFSAIIIRGRRMVSEQSENGQIPLGRVGFKEGKDSFICWQGHGISFFACTWYNFHWLSLKRKYNQRRVLCELIRAFERWNQEEWTAAFGERENVVSSRKCTISHIRYRDGQNQWVKVQMSSSRTPFARFSPLGLFYFSKLEKMPRWSKITLRIKGIFFRISSVFFVRSGISRTNFVYFFSSTYRYGPAKRNHGRDWWVRSQWVFRRIRFRKSVCR